jgi:hypothetical protein
LLSVEIVLCAALSELAVSESCDCVVVSSFCSDDTVEELLLALLPSTLL